MKLIKRHFDKLGVDFKDYIKKYPASNIACVILAVIVLILEVNYKNINVISTVTLFLVSSINVETYFKYNNKRRTPGYIIAFILAIGLPLIFDAEYYSRIYIGIHIVCVLLAIYKFIKEEENMFSYLHKVIYNLFKVGVFYVALFIGTLIIFLTFDEFIYEIDSLGVFAKIQYLLLSLFLFPFTLFSFVNTKDDVPKFFNILINKVLVIIIDILYLFIYIYVVKIIALRSMPSNEVFELITSTFIFSLFMLLFLNNFNDKLSKFNTKFIPYLFIIPYILQSYALIIRISSYGLTTSRYAGIYILIFELCSLLLYLIKDKKYLKYAVLILIFISMILFITPVINLEEAPIYSEIGTLKEIWHETSDPNKFTNEEKVKIKMVYDYLLTNQVDEKYLPDYLSYSIIQDCVKDVEIEKRDNYYSYYYKEERIDITGYNSLEEISKSYSELVITIDDYKVDLSNIYDDLVKEKTKNSYLIEMDSTKSLFVKRFDVNMSKNKIDYIYVEGYILTK